MLLIYVPTKDENEAKSIGKALVEENLACCINIIPSITSIFKWEGKLEETQEALLLIKTNSPYSKVKEKIESLHSYDIPLISAFEVDNINEKYKTWSENPEK
jgi:periplasmic divalent cation tolerance protein